jgi:hypothetical protein
MPGITDPDYLAWKAQQTRNNLQSRNQFRGIDVVEDNPNALGWQPIDNPPFTWPAKQYTDITGNQIQVQRGYMRSLITDPRWAANSAAKNRKLFFQFNPTVLVRSVQQTVGTMNPLLQDPAQLTMPVPGTSTFGFELLFNREKEVASGLSYLPGQQPSFEDSLVLPNGDAVLPSQIGVLADIMVLDTITGQGLSQDMLDMVKKQAQLQADTVIKTREERVRALNLEEGNESEVTIEQNQIDDLKTNKDKLNDVFNSNIGNQAFLNPLPFRVLFSSLFMIEGVATSVEVQYQKFSASMVPTQCKVIINMYALYIGFAQRDTFLTKNLEASFATTKAEGVEMEKVKSIIQYGIRSFQMSLENFSGTNDNNVYGAEVVNVFLPYSLSQSPVLADALSSGEIASILFEVYLEYNLSSVATPSADDLANTRTLLGKYSYDSVNKGARFDLPDKVYEDLYEKAGENPSTEKLAFRFSFKTIAKASNGTVVSTEDIYLPIQYNAAWAITRGGTVGNIDTWNNPLNNKSTATTPLVQGQR